MTTPTQASEPIPCFEALCWTYPTLRMFVAEAQDFQSSADPNFCANDAWYGHGRRQASLRDRVVTVADKAARRFGQRAYDVVYGGVYDLLPNCRNCGCLSREFF
jgi:hypothetical protein